MKTLKGIGINKIDYLETSRGVAYVAPVFMDSDKIGTLENDGNGGATTFRVYEKRKELMERIDEYIKENNIQTFSNPELFAQHLIDLHEFGRVLTEEDKNKLIFGN